MKAPTSRLVMTLLSAATLLATAQAGCSESAKEPPAQSGAPASGGNASGGAASASGGTQSGLGGTNNTGFGGAATGGAGNLGSGGFPNPGGAGGSFSAGTGFGGSGPLGGSGGVGAAAGIGGFTAAGTAGMINLGGSGGSLEGPPNPYAMDPARDVDCSTVLPLSHTVIAPSAYDRIIPLGNLNPTGHTLPTSHAYFLLPVEQGDPGSGPSGDGRIVPPQTVFAPSHGWVTWVARSTTTTSRSGSPQTFTEYGFEFSICKNTRLRFGHVGPLAPSIEAALAQATPVFCNQYETGGDSYDYCVFEPALEFNAGEELAKTSGQAYALDLGAFEYGGTEKPFVSPARYPTEARYNLCPFDLFKSEIKDSYYAKIQDGMGPRVGSPACGEIAYDVQGTAQGNWFPPGPGLLEDQAIAFAFHPYNANQPVISVGNSLSPIPPKAYRVTFQDEGTTNRPFTALTADGTIYCYEALITDYAEPAGGVLLVRVNQGESLTAEAKAGSSCANVEHQFTASARTFER